MGMTALAPNEVAAQFLFQKFDGSRESGLGHMAFFCRPREIQPFGNRDKIPNLLHFHACPPLLSLVYLCRTSGYNRHVNEAKPSSCF